MKKRARLRLIIRGKGLKRKKNDMLQLSQWQDLTVKVFM